MTPIHWDNQKHGPRLVLTQRAQRYRIIEGITENKCQSKSMHGCVCDSSIPQYKPSRKSEEAFVLFEAAGIKAGFAGAGVDLGR